MEYRKDLIERINKIPIPQDFKNYKAGIIPLGGGVVLKKVKSGERKTKGGLIIAETSQVNEPTGRIVAFGPDAPPYLRIGLLVTYDYRSNMETYVNGETLLLVHYAQVYHIIEEEDMSVSIAPETLEQKRIREKQKKQEEVLKRVYEKELNDEDKYEEKIKKNTKKSPKKKVTSKK